MRIGEGPDVESAGAFVGATADTRQGEADAPLPAPLALLVTEVVRRARLLPAERREVGAEITAHFRDGLDAGVHPDELLAAFGDVPAAARLIGRAKRRCRPLGWRLRRHVVQASAAAWLVLAPPYALSAYRLHSARPALAGVGRDDLATTQRLLLRSRALVAGSTLALARGDHAWAAEQLAASLAIAEQLGALRTLHAELTRITVLGEVVSAVAVAAHDPEAFGAADRALLGTRLGALRDHGAPRLRTDVVRAGFGDLLDRVYATPGDGGRPTARGLRLLQSLKGSRRPSFRARLLEPVYFAVPAGRDRVAAEVDRLLRIAEREAAPEAAAVLESELSRRLAPPLAATRYYPVALLMPRVAAALRESERLRRELPNVIDQLAVRPD